MGTPYRGRNRYRTILKAGRIISNRIAREKGVIGVLGTGAIGRGFGDTDSDLDLLVYAEPVSVRRLSRLVSVGWTAHRDVGFDIVVVSCERAVKSAVPSAFWSQIMRWHQQLSIVLHDTDGRVRKLLADKLIYPDREQKRLLKQYHQEIHEHLVFFPEMWARRGHLYNVVDTLMRAVQNIVLWIYASNKAFEPYLAKWPFYHLETKAVPEHVHLKRLTRIYTSPIRNLASAMRIRDDLLNLCQELGIRWEVYSLAEAHERARKNWRDLPEETKRILAW